MITNTIKITANGQITLPKEIRNILNTNIISLEVNSDNQIMVKPIYSVAGALKVYSKPNEDFNEVREISWKNIKDGWKK